MLMKKICLRAKNRESRQRQSAAAENRAAGLTAQLKELGERIGRPVAYLMTQIAYAESGESYERCL